MIITKDLERRLRDLIEIQKLQQIKAANLLGISRKQISRLIAQLGLKTQRTGPRSGPGHKAWKGGRIVDNDGYVLIYSPEHPNARKNGYSGRYMLEHRLVMEKHLGRLLARGEVVHHKDGNKKNNAISNLDLFAKNSDHLKHELTGKCPKWTPDGKRRIALGSKKGAFR